MSEGDDAQVPLSVLVPVKNEAANLAAVSPAFRSRGKSS
jgi:hypothetical protein